MTARRRQNRLRTFGWRADRRSPVTHNAAQLSRHQIARYYWIPERLLR